MWQNPGEYPWICIMITDNPKQMAGKLVRRSREDVLRDVKKWLDRHGDYLP